MTRAFALATCCVVAFFFCLGDARAGRETGATDSLEIAVDAPWPNRLRRGYEPVFVEVSNVSSASREVEVSISGELYGQRSTSVHDAFSVEPGKSVEREIPVLVPFDSGFNISVTSGGQRWSHWLSIGTGKPDDEPVILLFASNVTDWATWLKSRLQVGGAAPVEVVPLQHLPRRTSCLTSLDVVALDATASLPDAAQITALLAWTRLGGRVVFAGLSPQDLATRWPAFAPYLGARSQLDSGSEFTRLQCGVGQVLVLYAGNAAPPADSDSLGLPSSDRARSGVGNLLVGTRRASYGFDTGAMTNNESVRRIDATNLIPRFAPEVLDRVRIASDDGPSRGLLTFLLFVFTVLIGPFSFFYARKRGRPLLAFVFAPLFGLVGSGAVFVGAVFYAGFTVRHAGNSWAILDQRTHQVAIAENRALRSALSGSFAIDPLLGAVIPDYDSEFFGSVVFPDFFYGGRETSYASQFLCDVEKGFTCYGGFLPPRRLVRQLVTQEQATRDRLDAKFEKAGDGEVLVVTSGFSAVLTTLLVRTGPHEMWHFTGSRLAPGESARLERFALDEHASGRFCRDIDPFDPLAKDPSALARLTAEFSAIESATPKAISTTHPTLMVGEFAALCAERPFPLDGGLDVKSTGGHHLILGTLEDAMVRGDK